MNKESSTELGRKNAEPRQRLLEVRESLLNLHKVLLEAERASYEQSFGKIGTSYQFLQLLTTDPWFAWLHPVTQLIAAMDDRLDDEDNLTPASVEDLVGRVKTLLTPTPDGEGFSKHYDDALQREPDVLFAHSAMARLIRRQVRGAAG